jgi:surfeit locus 1 family protein
MTSPNQPTKPKWPILASIIVGAAVLTMIALGFWQLQRKAQKEALIAEYTRAADLPAMAYPTVPIKAAPPLFRKSSIMCIHVIGWQAVSGKSVKGKSGFAHLAQCQTSGAEGPGALVAIGWSNSPKNPVWTGGEVSGVIAPDNKTIIRLVASQPIAGLETLAPPSIDAINNNHFLYAIQWFFFASAAAVIFALALRRRWRDQVIDQN